MPTLWFDSFYASDFYRVKLVHPKHAPGGVYAYQTTEMSINTTSTWSTATDQPLDKFSKFAALQGKSALIDQFTVQSWQGTEPMDFTFNFAFIGVRDSANEVVKKARDLGKWPLPTSNNGITLDAPVATLGDVCSVETKYLSITNWLVPVSTNITFSSTLDKKGYPVRADVVMNFRTRKVVLVSDFMGFFKV